MNETRPTTPPLGGSDEFRTVESWDASRAEYWARALDQRAANPDQVQLRAAILALARIAPGQTVVEIGCGTGVLLGELAAAVGPTGKVIGIEPQAVLAGVAQQRLAERAFTDRASIRVERGSATALPAATAHTCIAQTVLLHLPDGEREVTLARMIALTRAGGCVISADQDADTWVIDHPDRDLTRRIVAFYSDQSFADGWTGRRLRGAFLRAGLRAIDVRVIPMLDTSAESYAYGRTVLRAQAAAKAGWITDDESRRWLATLHELAAAGQFFTSTNYYVAAGCVAAR
jgi:ubiquinone/menaquinone biosynthesis C-methylase UbiE